MDCRVLSNLEMVWIRRCPLFGVENAGSELEQAVRIDMQVLEKQFLTWGR